MPLEDALQQTVRQTQQRFYGKYRGFVIDNLDPEQRGRLKVSVPSVFGQQITYWALPCLPFGGLADQGIFYLPSVNAQVWVEFEEGNKDQPIWTGVFWQPSEGVPEEAIDHYPNNRVIKTPSGHCLEFDDEAGKEGLRLTHSKGSRLTIDEAGTVHLTDAQGAHLTLDAEGNSLILEDTNGNRLVMDNAGTTVSDGNGNEVVMSAGELKVSGQSIVISGTQVDVGGLGGEPLIKGQSFLSLFATHVHTCTAPGSPTSPPIPQGEMSTLTMTTKAK